MFKFLSGKFSKDLGIDLGTANIRIFVKEKGIAVNEPSIVAINRRTNQIVAIGREAREMLGKTPPHISITKPLVRGVISDFDVTEKMLRFFFDKIHEGKFRIAPHPKVIVGVPLEITDVERKAVLDAALSAGAREVRLVEEPMAAAIGARLPTEAADGSLIVDIGEGMTQIAVISLSGIVAWKVLDIAGEELNKNIVQYAKDVFGMVLGEKYAENIKRKIGSVYFGETVQQIEMRGRDILTGLPKEIIVTENHIREAIFKSVKNIAESIKAILEVTPPELVADIFERGLVLCGGGALLGGIDRLISEQTSVSVRIADDPMTCVARGAGMLLSNPELLKEVAINT